MNPPSNRAPRTGRLARSAIAGVATARVGAAQFRLRLSGDGSAQSAAAHEAKIGAILFAAFTQMRGTALKAAQVLSFDNALLPAGVRAELAQATHRVTPLNRALVGRVFRASFGCEPEVLFLRFEPTAFAAASLGQVHRATLRDGTNVAVKVQYPGIAATIDTDMRLLRGALGSIGSSLMPLPDPGVVARALDEIERQLRNEVDYLLEAEQQVWFKALVACNGRSAGSAHHAGSDILIADVVSAYSTRTVLTQQVLPGQHLDEWLAGNPSQAFRNRQGQAVFDWFLACAFKHRRIHADLHPGNFLFVDDGRVAVLDFGCTRELSPRFAAGLARSWRVWFTRAGSGGHSAALLHIYRELGLVDAMLDVATFEAEVLSAIAPMLDWATEAFTQTRFDFVRKSMLPRPDPARQATLMRHLTHMPPEMLSFDRAWLGLMHLLQRLGAVVDTGEGARLMRAMGEET